MERRSGNTPRSNKLLSAIPFRRNWSGLVVLAIAAILIWLGSTKSVQTPSRQQESSARPPGKKRDEPHARSSAQLKDPRPSPLHRINSGLPREIELYLEAFDEQQADEQFFSARDHIGPAEMEKLVLRFHLTKSTSEGNGILSLLADLHKTDTLSAAEKIVLREDLPMDDPIVLACATSLAKNGRAQSIRAILERLNQVVQDDSGDIPDHASALIHSISLVSAPEMEWFIGQAAEGKWTASSSSARMAAISALSSYPSVHTTSILARLRDQDASPLIRELAADVLARIQTQDDE